MKNDISLFSYYITDSGYDKLYISDVLIDSEFRMIKEHPTKSLYFYKSNIINVVKSIDLSISLSLYSGYDMCNILLGLLLNNGEKYYFDLSICDENFSILEKFLKLFPETTFKRIILDLNRMKKLKILSEKSQLKLEMLDNFLNKFPEQRLLAEIEVTE